MDGFNESALGKWLEGHKLLYQIFKFGIVGVVCFFIDYLVGLVAMNIIVAIFGKDSFEVASLIGSALGFIVSVIANYVLSFKFVFERKEDLDRKAEFVAFVSSTIFENICSSESFFHSIFIRSTSVTLCTIRFSKC